MKRRTMTTYDSYMFINKDPVIDKLRTLVQDAKVSYRYLEGVSRVHNSTILGMFEGKTRRPQHATVNAIARSLGKELAFVDISNFNEEAFHKDWNLFLTDKPKWQLIRDAKRIRAKKERKATADKEKAS